MIQAKAAEPGAREQGAPARFRKGVGCGMAAACNAKRRPRMNDGGSKPAGSNELGAQWNGRPQSGRGSGRGRRGGDAGVVVVSVAVADLEKKTGLAGLGCYSVTGQKHCQRTRDKVGRRKESS